MSKKEYFCKECYYKNCYYKHIADIEKLKNRYLNKKSTNEENDELLLDIENFIKDIENSKHKNLLKLYLLKNKNKMKKNTFIEDKGFVIQVALLSSIVPLIYYEEGKYIIFLIIGIAFWYTLYSHLKESKIDETEFYNFLLESIEKLNR